MHSHEVCQEEMERALQHGRDGRAEYLAMRCDMRHGDLSEPAPDRKPNPRVTALREQIRHEETSA